MVDSDNKTTEMYCDADVQWNESTRCTAVNYVHRVRV